MSNHDQMIEDFKSCTEIVDSDLAKQYLRQAKWDLIKAIQLVTPGETQKLPSEVITNDILMDISDKSSIPNSQITISDDFFNGPSTSNSRIHFNVYNENLDLTITIVLTDNDTVGHLKTAIQEKYGAAKCRQTISGWIDKIPQDDDEKLKNLNLRSPVQLSLSIKESPRNSFNTVNGLNNLNSSEENGTGTLHIFDEIHSKYYNISYSGSKTVLNIKTDMSDCSDIPVSQQVWSGWPQTQTSDDLTLGELGLTLPVHELSFRSAPILTSSNRSEKKKRNKISSLDSESDTSYSSNEDEDMQSVIADDLFEENFSSKNCIHSLVPKDFENEIMGSIQFAVSFQEKYGVAHPDFFPGTLDQAFKEACFKPAKDRKLLAVYLHHNGSVLTNVFCSELLCFESVLQYLAEHFIVWGWDVTIENNKTFLLHTVHNVLGGTASITIKSMKTEKYPIILIFTRARRNTEILSVIHGNVCLNELLSSLIQAVDMFMEQQVVETKEEEQRAARELIKVEQDEAYQQSLDVDRAKLEAKRKQEQVETEEQAKIERVRQKEAAKKETHRRAVESKLPPEPEDGVEGLIKIRIRILQTQFLERKFLKTDTLQLLLDFLVVRGYDTVEYKLITSFPRRDLTVMDPSSTLEELKLYPQETLIVEER